MCTYAGVGENSFILVSTQNTEFILVLLFTSFVLFSIQVTVNLLLPHPVYVCMGVCIFKITK